MPQYFAGSLHGVSISAVHLISNRLKQRGFFCSGTLHAFTRQSQRCDGKLGGSVLDGGNQLLGADSSFGKFLMQPFDSLGND